MWSLVTHIFDYHPKVVLVSIFSTYYLECSTLSIFYTYRYFPISEKVLFLQAALSLIYSASLQVWRNLG